MIGQRKLAKSITVLEPKIKESVDNAFKEGQGSVNASQGVCNMLSEYKKLYQAHDFYQTISSVLNDELSKVKEGASTRIVPSFRFD
ncbi:hypothetical protein ABD86_18660 [Paenibacillus alvei]|nr:hypothetical protein [Paenibacillus alvei]MBG9745874.1 hypothetical protein [Paenibacillus alvei]